MENQVKKLTFLWPGALDRAAWLTPGKALLLLLALILPGGFLLLPVLAWMARRGWTKAPVSQAH
jgi:hypothetical protein